MLVHNETFSCKMYYKLILFSVLSVKIFCVASLKTKKVNNNVFCTSTGKDLEDDMPIILNPPIYKNKLDNKNYLNFKADFYAWNILDSRNVSLGPVLDKRWENFPVEHGYFIEFKSMEDLTPFSVCARGKIKFNIFNNTSDTFGRVIYIRNDNIQGRNCKWKHYFIEIDERSVTIFENHKKVFSKTVAPNFTGIRVVTTLMSAWKRHFYEFQKIVVKDKRYALGTIENEGNLCVSLYVALSKSVSLDFELVSDKFSYVKTVNFITPKSSSNSTFWQNVKLNLNSSRKAELYVTDTSIKDHNSNNFWLIDLKNSKNCSGQNETQHFILNDAYNELYSCELITDDKIKINTFFEEHLVIESDQNKLGLQWKLPESIYVTKYIVTYQMTGKNMCNFLEVGEQKSLALNSNETNVEIKNLEYFAKYILNILIATDEEIVTITKHASTNSSPDIQDLTMNLTFIVDNYVNLFFEDCNQFNGPLNITLSLNCLDEWCLNKTQSDQKSIDTKNFLNNFKFTKFNLQTFTNYKPNIELRRFNKTLNKIFVPVRTNPGDPHPVRNLTFERTSSDLFLKWRAPYPPTGIVSHYIIKCHDNENFKVEFNVSSNNYCSGSTELLCFNMSSLNENTTYYIHIFVKNDGVEIIDSSMTFLVAPTFQKVTVAPRNLNLINDSSNKFQLSWDQPKGVIETLYVNISDETGKYKNYDNIQQNILELDLEMFLSYNISVKAKDKHYSNESTICVEIFPPVENLRSNFPLIQQCFNLTCTLTIFDSQKEKITNLILKNNNVGNREIKQKNTECFHNLKEPKNWKSFNAETLEKFYDETMNFGEVTGIIFNLNKKLFCISTKNVLKSHSSVYLTTIIPITVSIAVVCIISVACVYYVCRLRKKNGRVYDQSPEMEPLHANINQEKIISEPISTADLEKYLLECLKINSEKNPIVKQYMPPSHQLRSLDAVGTSCPPLETTMNHQFWTKESSDDYTRVTLKDNDQRGDYINANYISDHKYSKKFIATQAPKDNTIEDFWLMIWQNKASSVIMMTKLIEEDEIKCEKYWPELLKSVTFGEFKITNLYEKINPYFIERRLEVRGKDEKREIDHLQFTDWPIYGVPSHPQKLTQLLKRSLELPQNEIKVVHCHAGCGRTGCLILCEIALRRAFEEKKVDFLKILKELRNQRVSQVNSLKQYTFCYLSVLEYLKVKQFSIPLSDDFVIDPNLKPTLKILEILKIDSQTNGTHNNKKLPISADSFTFPNKFLAARQPSSEDVETFWQEVKEFKINVIIFLNEVGTEFNFEIDKEREVSKNLILRCEEKRENTGFSEIILKTDQQQLFIYKIKNWESTLPKSECEKGLISVLKNMFENFWSRDYKILVSCCDGIKASGLFIALTLIIEKMISKRVFDAFSAIRMLRQNEIRFLSEDEQIDYLYEFAKKHRSSIMEFKGKNWHENGELACEKDLLL